MAIAYDGINYFPIGVNFMEENAMEVIEAKYGIKGPAIVLKLLCKIYKEGYYIRWDEEQCLIFANKAGREVQAKEVQGIIEILFIKGILDRNSYLENGILTSESIQKVWLEATKRRKRDLNTLPYLLESCIQDEENSIPNKEYCMQPANISSQNADISEQSKVKQIKAETEEGSSDEHSLLPVPGYAYNKQTHNYDGLIFTLRQMKITKNEEVNAILRLSDYGRLKGYVWQVIHNTRWSEIVAKGKYLIAALVKEKKKTGN